MGSNDKISTEPDCGNASEHGPSATCRRIKAREGPDGDRQSPCPVNRQYARSVTFRSEAMDDVLQTAVKVSGPGPNGPRPFRTSLKAVGRKIRLWRHSALWRCASAPLLPSSLSSSRSHQLSCPFHSPFTSFEVGVAGGNSLLVGLLLRGSESDTWQDGI